MVKVKLRQKNPENLNEWIEKEIYLDEYLKSNLDLGMQQLHKDFDQVWFIDGAEGAGKSNLAITCAYYCNREESRHTLGDRIAVKIEDADKVILNAQPFDAVVIDEGYGGMSSGGSMSKINRLLQRRFTEIRAKNLFVFLVAPTFMDIQRYFAIWRSKCLLHVYTKDDERGYALFFNAEKKKRLYIMGRQQFYNYSCVPSNFMFRFTKQINHLIDYEAYKSNKNRKNLVEEEPEKERISKEVFKFVLSRLDEIEPSLTIDQKAQLLAISKRTVNRYNKEMREEDAS